MRYTPPLPRCCTDAPFGSVSTTRGSAPTRSFINPARRCRWMKAGSPCKPTTTPGQWVAERVLRRPRLVEPRRAGGGRFEVAHALHVAHESARRTAVGAEHE